MQELETTEQSQETQNNGQESDLKARLENTEHGQQILALMAVPGVQELLKAQQEGKAARVVTEEPESEEETEEEETTIDDPKLQAVLDAIDRKLKPLQDKIDRHDELATKIETDTIKRQVSAAAQKYPDFNEFRKEMMEINKTTPGLQVEDLYIIAKNRAGKLKPQSSSSFSERPTPTPRSSAAAGGKKAEVPRGRKGFASLLNDALKDYEFNPSDSE